MVDNVAAFLLLTFTPYIPPVAGAVIALGGLLLIWIMFQGFIPPEDNK